jgi:leucyl aminopeptidase
MQTVHRTPELTVSASPAVELDTELLVVPTFEEDDFGDEPDLDAATGGEIGRARARGELTGKPYQTFVTTLAGRGRPPARLVLVGVGPRHAVTPDHLRRMAATGGLAARQRRVTRATILHRRATGIDPVVAAQVMVEGVIAANFEGGSYKTGDPCLLLDRVDLRLGARSGAVDAAVERGRVLGECTNIARELCNEPGNALTPRAFAERAAEVGHDAGLAVDVLDETRIAALGMGLLLGVARGSQEPPRLVVLRHEPRAALNGAVLGLVGKGVTFDTGGISIKPAENMDRMKDDMAGGAAVIGAMAAIARLGAPIRCIGVIPMTENMPGGRAMKPGDVLRSASGKTVEILNTDAEGRLVLGDALWYARELGATHLVDVATLTGACVVALGKTTTGLFGSPDEWVDLLRRAGERAGERAWPMPVFEDYKEQLKSEIADLTNTGGRAAGAITGALFVKEFAGDLPWVHMDIAGTAWAEEPRPYQPKGATGTAARTLAELALDARAWGALVAPDPVSAAGV